MKGPFRHRLRVPAAALAAGIAALLSFTVAAAVARITTASTTAVRHPQARIADDQPQGQGPAGPRGPVGDQGPVGDTGLSGAPADLEQSATVNWEGGFANSLGRDSATFVAPGIGHGDFTCNQNTQWVHFAPYKSSTDVAMWTAKFQGTDTSVRTARHTTYTGATFYEGLNHYAGELQSEGSMIGIISSDGDKLGGTNGAGPPPTTFRLSWNWDFSDPNNPYCFMAATVVSNGA